METPNNALVVFIKFHFGVISTHVILLCLHYVIIYSFTHGLMGKSSQDWNMSYLTFISMIRFSHSEKDPLAMMSAT